jgi:xylulokinase
MFLDWVGRLLPRPRAGEVVNIEDLPVWIPYPRGERTPYHDSSRRAVLDGLDLTHGPAAVQRAAWEASGFVVRHHLDLAAAPARRIVATGGGTRQPGWMQGLADATGLPVHVSAIPDTAAQGAAFLARMALGLESDMYDAERWARTERVVEPDPAAARAASGRYQRFLELSGPVPDFPEA